MQERVDGKDCDDLLDVRALPLWRALDEKTMHSTRVYDAVFLNIIC